MKLYWARFLISFFLIVAGCSKNNSGGIPVYTDTDSTTLKEVAPFKIGAAIDVSLLQNDILYRNILIKEHSSITTENTLKWPTVHPDKNTFNFLGGDYIADFCEANGKRLHGHCLIWYQSNPDWLNNFTGDSLAWETLFKTHIQTVVGHYKGRVTGWDVVNEAFNDSDGSLRVEDIYPDNFFDDGSIWARHLGRDYVARAFQYAHEADPDALLFYNDYGQEWNERKTDSILFMVNDFIARGIPISGLGLQMHMDINTTNEGITKAIKKLAATGLQIHISELDISVNTANNPNLLFTDNLALLQAEKYAFVVSEYKKNVPLNQQYGITTWNVGDRDSWIRTYLLRKDWPLLFDDSYARKLSYFKFRDALQE